jgi:hypothetical protein
MTDNPTLPQEAHQTEFSSNTELCPQAQAIINLDNYRAGYQ